MANNNQDMIAAILAGELAEDSPEAKRAFAADSSLGLELQQLRSLEELLHAEASLERGAQAASQIPVGAGPRPRKPRLWFTIGAAAAMVMALFAIAPLMNQNTTVSLPGIGQRLGAESPVFRLSQPLGPRSSFDRFTISGKIPLGASIAIEIWNNQLPGQGELIYRHKTTVKQADPQGFTWFPPLNLTQDWPSHIGWGAQIQYLDGQSPTVIPRGSASR